MALQKCRLCDRLYAAGSPTEYRVCGNCRRKLEDLYGHVHEYMRDNKDEEFDIYKLSEAMEISTAEVQALVDLGYLDRDLQTYARSEKEKREKLVEGLNGELKKFETKKAPVTTYGGIVYSRRKRK